jgi:WS/DGAT/MGAT family acyltransferase
MVERPNPGPLSAADSLMWRIEADPVLRSPVLVVGLLDRSPTSEGLAAMVEDATLLLPRLRRRIEPPPWGLGRPRWADVDDWTVGYHLRRVRAPEGGLGAVLAVAEPDAAAAFDPARPPWTMTIVDGLDHGRSAVVLRFHHAISDGMGGIALADRLFDRTRRPDHRPAWARIPEDGAVAVPPRREPLALTGTALAAARRGVAAAAHPGPTFAALAGLGHSAVRLIAAAPAGSPELGGRSLDRWLAVSERPLAAVQHAARASGGTVNDVLLAAVAGALADYHLRLGRPVPAVRVTMPISIRRSTDAVGGNRFVPVRFTLPVDDPDPRARVRIAGAIARSWRSEPAVGVSDLLATGLNLLPRPFVSRLFGGMLRSIDVDVANVVGLDRRAYLAGARIDRLWAFAPPTGAALSVTLVSHRRTCCIGLACDRRAVADPELLHECLDDALTEVVALGRAPISSAGSAVRLCDPAVR